MTGAGLPCLTGFAFRLSFAAGRRLAGLVQRFAVRLFLAMRPPKTSGHG